MVGAVFPPCCLNRGQTMVESEKWKWKSLTPVQYFATPWIIYSPWNSPGQNTGVNSFALLQGIFPTQGSSPGICTAGKFFTKWATWEAQEYWSG